jgi:hypothetical protein
MCKRLLLLTQMIFYGEINVFLQLSWIGLLGKNEHFYILKMLIGRIYSLQKLTQYSEGNNVLDVASTRIDSFLWRGTCVSSPQLNRRMWNKMSLSPLWKLWWTWSTSFKRALNSPGKNMLDLPGSNTDSFPSRDTCVSSSNLNTLFARKW